MAGPRSADGLTPSEQLAQIGERAQVVATRLAGLYRELAPLLAGEGIRILRWTELDEAQTRVLQAMFGTRIFPVLTPLAVDPGHPFPYISNLSLNLAIRVEDPDTHLIHFARVKVPPLLGRFVSPEPGIFVPLEDVIAANLGRLFPGMRVLERHVFRVTRNADLEVDDDGAEDLLEALEEEIRRRRSSPAVRLEIEEGMPPEMRNLLARELQIGPADIYTVPGPSAPGRAGGAPGPGSAGPQGPALPGPHAGEAGCDRSGRRGHLRHPARGRPAGSASLRLVRRHRPAPDRAGRR